MSNIYNEIENTKLIIDCYACELAGCGRVSSGDSFGLLTGALTQLLPQIIALYQDERMAEYEADAVYWSEQLKRILGAIEQGDVFLVYDALVNELKANLTELQKIITNKDI